MYSEPKIFVERGPGLSVTILIKAYGSFIHGWWTFSGLKSSYNKLGVEQAQFTKMNVILVVNTDYGKGVSLRG